MIKNDIVAISNKNPTANVEITARKLRSISEKFHIRKQILVINDNSKNRPIKALSNENLDGNNLVSIVLVVLDCKSIMQF